ncbi:hypothetical protein [Streptomyces sp. SP18CS02]|uniref:hypothetical protein n=1 Tax=Streptomyces sp. SP18CS02 TaxID=3002531 RepID=UPI002E792089|nr:hypothetical protein [Streptomyces sp. SP18CS02]MEE1751208.1 hypothetical protein [Streptomyces sp. SP18CS02]
MHDVTGLSVALRSGYGVTALDWSSYGEWISHTASRKAYVRSGVQQLSTGSLKLLVEDLLLLDHSVLSDAEIGSLWQSIDPYVSESPAPEGRDDSWLAYYLDTTLPVIGARGIPESEWAAIIACAQERDDETQSGRHRSAVTAHRMLTGDVLNLIVRLDWYGRSAIHPHAVKTALVRCTQAVCSELAFRFVLRAYPASGGVVSRKLFQRMRRPAGASGTAPSWSKQPGWQ